MNYLELFQSLKQQEVITDEQFESLKTLKSVEQINSDVQSRLARQKEKYEAQIQEMNGFKEENDSLRSQLAEFESVRSNLEALTNERGDLASQLEEAQGRLKEINFTSLRDQLLAEQKLPVRLPKTYVELIPVTDDADQLRASIEEVATRYKEENPAAFQVGGGANPPTVEKTLAEMSISEAIARFASQ